MIFLKRNTLMRIYSSRNVSKQLKTSIFPQVLSELLLNWNCYVFFLFFSIYYWSKTNGAHKGNQMKSQDNYTWGSQKETVAQDKPIKSLKEDSSWNASNVKDNQWTRVLSTFAAWDSNLRWILVVAGKSKSEQTKLCFSSVMANTKHQTINLIRLLERRDPAKHGYNKIR